jgi:A/G-specific adenine glycosylase
MDKVDGFQSALLEWFPTAGRSFSWRAAEATRYEVFLAEFFLTQTPAEIVATVYPTFLEQFPSLPAVEDSPEETLQTAIRPLGFQRMRATALKEIAATRDELPGDVRTM